MSTESQTTKKIAVKERTPAKPAAAETDSANPLRRAALIVVAVTILLFALSIVMERLTPSSSQAVVQAYVVRMAPEVAGRVIDVDVADNARVDAGQVLFRIDPRPFEIAVAEAQAEVEQLTAGDLAAVPRDPAWSYSLASLALACYHLGDAGTGAALLWRVKSNAVLPVEKRYSDGSFASHIYPGTKARRNDTEGIEVRVIEYTLAAEEADTDTDDGPAECTYRLITTITDPAAAPAAELAQLYTQRWEIETAFDELKTHQRGPGLVLRSKMPDGVIQEVYGYLCVHYAIRWLIHSAATDYGHDPDRLSFIRSLRAARRTTASHPGFSP